jgi:hypothetical protein
MQFWHLARQDRWNFFASQQKQGFSNMIQISSCLESQNSLTGDPLSMFTEKFRAAALRKTGGTVFYTDVISSLRDEFINNQNQTPFFVSQGTGREQFTDDAKCFDALRARLAASAASSTPPGVDEQRTIPAIPTLRERLQNADANMATSSQVAAFIGNFFDTLLARPPPMKLLNFLNGRLPSIPISGSLPHGRA